MVGFEHSSELKDLAAALAKAQSQTKGAIKDSTNPFFKSSYADLSSVWDACRQALNTNGLSVTQFPGYADGVAIVTTMLLHSSGQWIRGSAGAPLKTADAQGVGSAITYLRRYALAAVVGVVQDDDDGAGATRKARQKTESKAPAQQSPPRSPVQDAVPGNGPRAAEAPGQEEMRWKGKPLSEHKSDALVTLRAWCARQTNQAEYGPKIEAIDALLAARQGE